MTDCIFVALAALKLVGITLATVPSVVVDADLARAGRYLPDVVYVRSQHDCAVYVHEFVHHRQFLALKRLPKDAREYLQQEHDAAATTMYAMLAYQENLK